MEQTEHKGRDKIAARTNKEDKKDKKGKQLAEEIIGTLRSNYPASPTDEASFNALFKAICDTYDLKNPVDQLIANRAATQFLNLQYCQEMLKKYGLFYINQDDKGRDILKVNELAYFIKQLESEFRSNLRLIQGRRPLPSREGNFNFLEELSKIKKKK